MPPRAQRIPITPDLAGRVDRVVQHATSATRSRIRGMIDAGCVRINGRPAAADFTRVAIGDVVEIDADPQRRYREKPRAARDSAYTLVFEDGDVLVVDKAAWALTVPTDSGETNSLVDRLRDY